MTRLCDYEGSTYRSDFWEGQGREYEDLAERIALRRLLPSSGERLVEIGAGYGRLADLYRGYGQVVIQDYARSQLEEARRYLGPDERYIYVAANVYALPFADNSCDALTMVRVMHHLVDVPAALAELQRITQPDGAAVVEFANKQHLKAIVRWGLGRQSANPFASEPDEFVSLNFNFQPGWMRRQFEQAGFEIEAVRSVSHFRLPFLKRFLPAALLARLDGWLQPTGRWWQLSPSIFLKARPRKAGQPGGLARSSLFRCPACHSPDLRPSPGRLICQGCQRQWAIRDGIYDFKSPLPAPRTGSM